jgi:hypothetical protein
MNAAHTTWKLTAAKNVRSLTPEEACATIERITAEGVTIFHEDIKKITGGYVSQNINGYVMRLLGIRCGLIKGRA